jgi:hypothetical protein
MEVMTSFRLFLTEVPIRTCRAWMISRLKVIPLGEGSGIEAEVGRVIRWTRL